MQRIFKHLNPNNKTKILDFTYTSQPQINSALPLQKSNIRLSLFIIGCILSAGFLWLVTKWSSRKKAILMYSVCQDSQATHFLIQQQGNIAQIVERTDKLDIKHRLQTPAFIYHERTYLYHPQKQCFLPVRYQQLGLHLDQMKNDQYQPHAQNQRQKIRQYFGTNIINLPVKTRLQIFLQQMLTPYQVFQTYAIILWIYESYFLFSFLLIAYSLYTYWCNSTQITANQQKLKKQSYFDTNCKILIGNFVAQSESKIMANSKIKQAFCIQQSQLRQKSKQQKYDIELDIQIQPRETQLGSQQKMKSLSLKNEGQWKFQQLSSQMIIPGDIIILKQGDTVPCDCILLSKQILVNQSYTTGQSYLVRKTPIKDYIYTIDAMSSFTLFLGTKIIKIKSDKYKKKNQQKKSNQQFYLNKKGIALSPNQILCFVTDTNYNTQRGKFLRAIRHQKRNQQTFTKQTIYFIYILFGITLIAFFTILYRINEKGSTFVYFIRFLDLLTLCIPPTLPTALSVGINFAQIRLRKKHIHCVLPQNILTGGRTDVIVLQGNRAFGKQVQVQSVIVGVKNQRGFGSVYFSLDQFKQDQYKNKIARMFFRALASCHTLQMYEDKIQGQRQESELMKFCGGQFEGQDLFKMGNSQILVQRRIYFKHKEKKLAVLVDIKDNELKNQFSLMDDYNNIMKQQGQQYNKDQYTKKVVFIKGPPEKIVSICKPNTYPADSYAYFVDMAQKGFLIIAYAFKYTKDAISQQQMHQTKQQFTFLGFAILKRKIHPDAQSAVDTIKNANLKLLYVSQQRQLQANSLAILNHVSTKNQLLSCTINKAKDQIFCRGHIQWQSNVGQNCISEFAMQVQDFGKNSKLSLSQSLYQQIFMRKQQELYDKIFNKSVIFNKMQHKHERNVYYQLEKRKLVSFAVGGGGTLSQCANLSMQLQRSQSSLLSSFHTEYNSLQTVINCLKICRAGLSTNFHCFNMMILFSITQFTTVVMLEYNYQTISDDQMLYEDLFVTFPIFITMSLTQPTDKLSKQRPICSFFSLRALLSMGGLIIFQLLAQITFFLYLSIFSIFEKEKQRSYEKYLKTGQFNQATITALSTFILTNYIFLGAILATSVSKSFRRPFYTNPFYTVNIFVLWVYNNIIVLFPALAPGQIRLKNLNQQAQFDLLMALIYGNLIMLLMYLYEVVLDSFWVKCHKNNSNMFKNQLKTQNEAMNMVQQG